jgi:hypothetical protein
MSGSAQTPPPAPSAGPAAANTSAAGKTASKRPAIIGAVGVLIVLAAAGLVAMKSGVFTETGSSSIPKVTFVDLRDINDAAATLTQSVAGGLVDDAKHCKIPLASMTIAKGTAQVGSTFRIRAGSYVSPYFTVTEGVQRIAMPYPAPYGSGSGTYVVEGNATGAILGLTPTKVLLDLPNAQSIPVVWRATNPC